MMQAPALARETDHAALLRLHPRDDVAIAVRDIQAGERLEVDGIAIEARQAVPFGHKLAVRSLASGEVIRKFGWPIGRMTAAAASGEHVHVHNLATLLSGVETYRYEPAAPEVLPASDMTFRGYRRADGRAGTRNEIWVLPTVGCVARTATKIAEFAGGQHAGRVDGIHAFTHPHGCSQLGDDLAGMRALLASLACHPNAGGVLLIGLGC
jgi:altronate hydrolase